MTKAFDFFDNEKQGEISISEFTASLKSYGFDQKNAEIYKIFENMDEDGEGVIEFKDFLDIMTSKVGENSSKEELGRVFKLFDSDATDFISLENLQKVSQEVGDNLGPEELADILTRCDIDKNGKLNFEDFYTVITTRLH